MSCLRKHAHVTDVSANAATGAIEASVYELPAPILPESMVLTRKDMLHYLRRNFDLGKHLINNAPRKEREEVHQATVSRCVPLIVDIKSTACLHDALFYSYTVNNDALPRWHDTGFMWTHAVSSA